MINIKRKKGTIGILTGGGDVPGLNPAIRAITLRALNEGYQVIGLKRGWDGLLKVIRDKDADNSDNFMILTEEIVNKVGRTGGTFIHTSQIVPSSIEKEHLPLQYRDKYNEEINDLTSEIIKNIDFLGIDYLIPIGGDETLNYAVRLYKEGVKVVGIPKTMENDVPGTDYCIGFSTCITRTIQLSNQLRTTAGSHERILVIEVFGRYAGFTAMLPTMAGAAHRCVIPEYKFDIDLLTKLLIEDRKKNPSKYSVLLVSEGASFHDGENNINVKTRSNNSDDEISYDILTSKNIGEIISAKIREISPKYNNSEKVSVIYQQLGYLVRGGDPDAIDSIVPMAYGNLALDLILKGIYGRLIVLRNGRYDNVPIDIVTKGIKTVDVKRYYNTEELKPYYKSFEFQPLFIMTGN